MPHRKPLILEGARQAGKTEENLKAKSLSTVLKTNAQLKGIRFSMSDYREQKQMVNVPLYLVEFYLKWIASEGL